MRKPCLRAPARVMGNPGTRELLAFVCQHHKRTGRAAGLLDALCALPHRDGREVWRALVQLEREGLTARAPTLGITWRWKPTGAGDLRRAADAAETKNPAACEAAGLHNKPLGGNDMRKVAPYPDRSQGGAL